jgi:hypothetical protein
MKEFVFEPIPTVEVEDIIKQAKAKLMGTVEQEPYNFSAVQKHILYMLLDQLK